MPLDSQVHYGAHPGTRCHRKLLSRMVSCSRIAPCHRRLAVATIELGTGGVATAETGSPTSGSNEGDFAAERVAVPGPLMITVMIAGDKVLTKRLRYSEHYWFGNQWIREAGITDGARQPRGIKDLSELHKPFCESLGGNSYGLECFFRRLVVVN